MKTFSLFRAEKCVFILETSWGQAGPRRPAPVVFSLGKRGARRLQVGRLRAADMVGPLCGPK